MLRLHGRTCALPLCLHGRPSRRLLYVSAAGRVGMLRLPKPHLRLSRRLQWHLLLLAGQEYYVCRDLPRSRSCEGWAKISGLDTIGPQVKFFLYISEIQLNQPVNLQVMG